MTDTVLITGANRGIGLEFVRQYAAAGWRVFAGCRSPENAGSLLDLAQRYPEQISVHPLDVTQGTQIGALRAAVGSTPIDLLINNAGTYGQKNSGFGSTDEALWLECMRINVIAPMKMMEAFADAVAASGQRVIASLSSKMGSISDNTSGGSYVYRSSKAALNAVMKSAAIDLRERGITAVILHPGWVQTDMGGPNALITVEESVTLMRKVLDGVQPADAGTFFDKDGTVIPW